MGYITGQTKLMNAVLYDYIGSACLCLDRGDDPDIKNEFGRTALMMAAYNGYTRMVGLLLDYGADPNICDNSDWTALMNAANRDHMETVELLLNRGADHHIRSICGNTAYHLTSRYDIKNMINSIPSSLYTMGDRSREYMSTSYHDISIYFS